MKKYFVLMIITAIVAVSGCALTMESDVSAIIEGVAYNIEPAAERKNLKLGVVAGPYGDMFLETILPYLAPKGYTVELVLYDDFIEPNIALSNYEVDLNMFQHYRYLNNFKIEHDLDLSAVAEIPTVSMGVFSQRSRNIDDIREGAVVAIPDDATNLARALRVLESAGLVTIDARIDKSRATVEDLSRNQRNLEFIMIPANQLVSALPNSDAAVINGNFAFAGGLNISEALYNEVLLEGYVNIIAVRTEDLGRQFVRDILDVVHSEDFKRAIVDVSSKYNGFQLPLSLTQLS